MDCRCLPAFSKQHLTEGSMLDPPNAATSPSSRGIWTQSCRRTPSFGASTNRLGSAISRNKSNGRRKCFVRIKPTNRYSCYEKFSRLGGDIGFLLFHKVSTSLNPAIKIPYPRKRRGFGPFILFFERRTSGTQQTDTTKSRSWSDKQ